MSPLHLFVLSSLDLLILSKSMSVLGENMDKFLFFCAGILIGIAGALGYISHGIAIF